MNSRKPLRPVPPRRGPNGDDEGNVNRIVRSVLVWMVILLCAFVVFVIVRNGGQQPSPVTYNEYQRLLNSGAIKKAIVYKSQLNDFEFRGELGERTDVAVDDGANRKMVQTNLIATKLPVVDAAVLKEWMDRGLVVSVQQEGNEWWGPLVSFLPWFALIAIWIFVFRRMQGGVGGTKGIFSFGKSRARMLSETSPRVTFADVVGADEAKEELQEIIDFLREPGKFQRLGGKIPRGVLLLGPPGTGKTLLARAVAGEAGVQYLSISGADFVEMFVGVGASRVRDLFEQAKKIAPAIIFIDEIDAVGRQRGAGLGGGHDEREQTLNALLVEMDGFEQNTGVIIIAATNRPDVLDPALLRPGRFDRQVVVDRPDRRGREGILKVHTRNMPLAENVDLMTLARATPGFSGADLANLANEAAINAARRNGDKVTMYDFEMAKDKLMLGLERRSMVMSDEERKMTAYHEVGHVLVGTFVPHGDPVHKVTIIPRGRALGVTAFLPDDDQHSRSREWFEAKIAMALGGRAAELTIFGNYTSGAQGDIKTVTQLARQMVCELGMSEKLGPINYASNDGEVFLGRDFAAHKDISEATAEMIDKEVREIVDNGMNRAMGVLREHMDILHKMSALLIERETLDSDEIDAIIRGEELSPIEVKRMLQARLASGQGADTKPSTSRPSATVIGPGAGGRGSDISTGPDPSVH
ncbi:MAG: ATP-dependent zinc metalloprotease FtsH [Candidatus Kapaibacterium sp.]